MRLGRRVEEMAEGRQLKCVGKEERERMKRSDLQKFRSKQSGFPHVCRDQCIPV